MSARGFSLIEVILALGLLAGVLVATASMLVVGSHHAKSGRASTEALSTARTIVEEMQGWGFRQSYLAFGLDGTATSYTVDTRTNGYAGKWQPMLDAKLKDSYATIDLLSLDPGGTPSLATTRAIRVNVTVHWVEGGRSRTITLGGVRL